MKLEEVNVRCAHCGKESRQKFIFSSSSFGAMDLDTRPAPPARKFLSLEIQRCPHCGYCAPDISEGENIRLSPAYEVFAERGGMDGTGKNFLLAAMLCSEQGKEPEAGIFCLKAAWAFDDAADTANAAAAREKAAEHLLRYVDAEEDGDIAIVLVDVYRRAGMFSEAEGMIGRIGDTGDEDMNAVLAYQRRLIRAKDVSRHTVEEAEA